MKRPKKDIIASTGRRYPEEPPLREIPSSEPVTAKPAESSPQKDDSGWPLEADPNRWRHIREERAALKKRGPLKIIPEPETSPTFAIPATEPAAVTSDPLTVEREELTPMQRFKEAEARLKALEAQYTAQLTATKPDAEIDPSDPTAQNNGYFETHGLHARLTAAQKEFEAARKALNGQEVDEYKEWGKGHNPGTWVEGPSDDEMDPTRNGMRRG